MTFVDVFKCYLVLCRLSETAELVSIGLELCAAYLRNVRAGVLCCNYGCNAFLVISSHLALYRLCALFLWQ